MTPSDPGGAPAAPGAAAPAARCSTAEREQTCRTLHEACGEGRLSMEETEERLGHAYAARHRHELAGLTADLPTASGPHGWGLVAATARRQLLDDVAVLTGRAAGDRARVMQVLMVIVAMALLATAAILFLAHGIVPDGPEFG